MRERPPGWFLFHCIVCCRPLGILPVCFWRSPGKILPAFTSHETCHRALPPFAWAFIRSDAEYTTQLERRTLLN